jgi:hypothetical protein
MTITFSRRLAVIFGILAPLAETIRRWNQLGQLNVLPFWLDDYIMGAFLIYGAWRAKKDMPSGLRVLAAAWGFTCGMGYASFFSQLTMLNQPDPAPISSGWVAVIKGVGSALSVLALIACLRGSPESQGADTASQAAATSKASAT